MGELTTARRPIKLCKCTNCKCMTVPPPHLTLNNLFKGFNAGFKSGSRDGFVCGIQQRINGGWVKWEEKGGGGLLLVHAQKKREIKTAPSANQKTQLSLSISARKTQRAALVQRIGGLDQNNYCVISPSDHPQIDPALICTRYRGGKAFPSCRWRLSACAD